MRSSITRQMSPSRSSTWSASRPSYASVTRNEPCSNFILMMRPMCGSSSATSTWTGVVGTDSDQGRDVFPIASKLEQQLADVGALRHENEEKGVARQHRNDGEPVSMLEDGRQQLATPAGLTEVVRGGD